MVYLKPPGVEGLGRVTVSMCDWMTGLGTFNYKIPSHSDLAYEIRICGLVISSNTQKHMGYDLGWETCLMSATNWPRKGWHLPLWDIQEWLVGLRVPCLGILALVILWGNIFWYLLRGIVLTCTPGSILMVMFLVLFFVVSNNLIEGDLSI